MSTKDRIPRPSDSRAREEAADWLARRDAGWTPGEQVKFESWMRADPANCAAVDELEQTWSRLARPHTAFGDMVLRTLTARAQRRRRRRWQFGAVAGVAAVAALIGWRVGEARFTEAPAIVASERIVPRPHQQVLEDGSVVELNSHAVVEVEYSATVRRVVLRRGIAHFAVAKDPSRPFVVLVGQTTVKAVGTEFTVELASASVEVLVAEGTVDVALASASSDFVPVRLDAGLRATVLASGAEVRRPEVSVATPAEMARALAWRGKRVELNDMPLDEAVALFNRHNDFKLEVGDRAAGQIKVSGICWVDNPRAFARMVEATFGVHVEERSGNRLALRSGAPVLP